MKEKIDLAVIIPAGPGDDVLDTLGSVAHYTVPSRVILVVDDGSTLNAGLRQVEQVSKDIIVIPAPLRAPGGHGGLFVKLAAGYRWVLERYEPQIILRMDADALVIGAGLETMAIQEFEASPDTGLLGCFQIGPDGGLRDSSWAKRQLRIETSLLGLRHPRCRSALREWLDLAHRYGYKEGESVLGGAYIHSYRAARDIYESGWFHERSIAASSLGEDHLMSLVTMAVGYRIKDFGGPADPMALKWRGLPAHPENLLETGKLITHSVRFWRELDEREIRQHFARARAQS